MVIGIILMAFFYQRGNIFIRKSGLRPQRRASRLFHYDSGEEGSSRNKDSTATNGRTRKANAVTSSSGKVDRSEKDHEYLKNNHEMNLTGSYTRSNDYTNMPGPIANGASANKFVLNPVPTGKKATSAAPPVGAKFNKNTIVDKGAAAVSVEPTKVATPTECDVPAHKTRSASAVFATSYGRGMVPSNHCSDPNLKSNAKLEESLTNHDREAYGRNILARQPSVDTNHKLAGGVNGRTRLHPPVLHVAYDRRHDVINLPDISRSCSQC